MYDCKGCLVTCASAGVCGGVHEYQVNYDQRYRVYLGHSGQRLVIVLAGATKNARMPISGQLKSIGRF